MKPRTSFSSAAVAGNSYGSSTTRGGFGSNSIFSPIGSTAGPVKEGLVSQIASKFQQQVGVSSNSENETETQRRKKSDPIISVNKYIPSSVPSQSGDSIGSNSSALRKISTKSDSYITSSTNRTDSHQTRFHNARAMFEKLGSTDDLDSVVPSSPTVSNPPPFSSSGKPFRALSVGSKPVNSETFPNNKSASSNASSITSSYNSNFGIRSRSTSPFGGSRSSSQSSLKQSASHSFPNPTVVRSSSGNFSSPQTSQYKPTSPTSNGTMIPPSYDLKATSKSINGHLSDSVGLEANESWTNGNMANDSSGNIRKKSGIRDDNDCTKNAESTPVKLTNTNNEETAGHKTSLSSIARPNIKELTNKQRNWFSNFERGKTSTSGPSGSSTPESVDSSRRTSVKQDHVPNILSGFDNPVPDATPTPSANLNQPGDRRPLNALTSSSSDSIEDYIRNWKKTDTTPSESLLPQLGSPIINDR